MNRHTKRAAHRLSQSRLHRSVRFAAIAAVGCLIAPLDAAADEPTPAPAADAPAEAPFTLDLPEWNPDPEDLPPELRPLDVVRPTLPEDVAKEVAELEARITEIEATWLDAETREAQDALLDEAIGLAERALALREAHQGNSDEVIRWRDASGQPSVWWEVVEARRNVIDLRLYKGLSDGNRAALGSLEGTDEEVRRLFGLGDYAEAESVVEHQIEVRRQVLGAEHPRTLSSISSLGVLLEFQGRLAEAEPHTREAMNSFHRILGSEHPWTITPINNLGALLKSQGKLSEAEQYTRGALAAKRRVLGDDNPSTIQSISNLGLLLESQGKFVIA